MSRWCLVSRGPFSSFLPLPFDRGFAGGVEGGLASWKCRELLRGLTDRAMGGLLLGGDERRAAMGAVVDAEAWA